MNENLRNPNATVSKLAEPVTRHLHQQYATLRPEHSVGEALAWLRAQPPAGPIVYFYVVDDAGVLRGVVPTRRLILSAPTTPIADIMVRQLVTLPSHATVLEACECFVLHRLLAFPVVDDGGRLIGIVDIDLYRGEIERLKHAAPATRWLRPFAQFLQIESVSGLVLVACTLIALALANSPWSAPFQAFWEHEIGLDFGAFVVKESLLHWINDGLMMLFFFVVGLEIKREFAAGELSDWQKAVLPIAAAAGGMLAPALIYLLFHRGTPTARGWGVPTATDIAFVVGFLVLLGPRVPQGLKVLLLSLAIVDDIGAILVIALGYNQNIAPAPLAGGLAGLGLVVAFRWAGVRHVLAYTVLGLGIWLGFLTSGVHPTAAAVALGLLTPARPLFGEHVPIDLVSDLLKRVTGLQGPPTTDAAGHELVSPAERLEHALHPWVAFVIMPLFALANAGVALEPAALARPVAGAVGAALVLGKPLGIVLFSLAFLAAGWAKLPEGVTLKVLLGGGCLAGIGFTMSLFIAGLAFEGEHLHEAKVGILAGSALSAGLGSLLLWWLLPKASGHGKG